MEERMKKGILVFAVAILIVHCGQQRSDRRVIQTTNAPAAIGPFSQAIRVGNTLYLSGQLGLDPKNGNFAEGGFEAQARQALENQKAVLAAAGFTLNDVVECQVFVKDMNLYSTFNKVYAEYFKKDFPARAVLEVARIPKDGLVEIMMVAVKAD